MYVNYRSIDNAAQARLSILVPWLLPVGQHSGSEWVALNPTRDDKNLGSFRINLSSGKWSDFAVENAKGIGAISLVSYIRQISKNEAARVVARFVGGGYE